MQSDEIQPKVWVAWFSVGCIAAATVLTFVGSWLTPDANMVASTISDVAAGPYDWVQDSGFYILSAGLLALAYGMYNLHTQRWHWLAAIATLPIMAVAVTVMGFYQEYGDGDHESGEIHIYLVYAFGFAFLALLLLSIPHLMTHNSWWRPLNLWWLALWIAGAVYYFNMGTGYDGLVERALGFAYLAWMFLLAWRLAIEGGSPWGKTAATTE
ncbi:hypothetical protein Pla123a_49080 [Posidoniimonas polymericola]|uniref:DUF998 domain-containing protein n=1 Tax=Posidoniimonas polymericola TaxID=2528002 RepID=A0A5C5XRC3_9BACT|nr:DUF998 domain-containing protein [Posidoniimonas polymericola]TWT65440.1 hypothetical protein Pla123a_49080 [Posidoniimonas polymericola]